MVALFFNQIICAECRYICVNILVYQLSTSYIEQVVFQPLYPERSPLFVEEVEELVEIMYFIGRQESLKGFFKVDLGLGWS